MAAPDAPAADRAEIVVGLLSRGDETTIAHVSRVVCEALTNVFGGHSSRIVLIDHGSEDGTVARARTAIGDCVPVTELPAPRGAADLLELPYHGIPGKARSIRALLSTAQALDARACVVLDAGVDSVAPDWIERLVGPLFERDLDLVSPFYRRQAHEGAMTRGIVYPMFRALFGLGLRQPAAAEFACSARARDLFLDADIWERDGAQVGIDLWLTAVAASGEMRIAEAGLGERRHHGRGDSALDLATTFSQVVGALFSIVDAEAPRWQRLRESIAVERLGSRAAAAPAGHAGPDPERLIESFTLAYRELRDVWTWVLPPRTIVDIGRLVPLPPSQFRIGDDLWSRIVFDFALGYRLRALARDHLLRSMVPLYLGWLASFVLDTHDMDVAAAERRAEQLARTFEAEKGYVIAKWRWPERLRT